MEKKPKLKPYQLQVVNIRSLDSEDRDSLIMYIAMKWSEEPFWVENNEYVLYSSYSRWWDNKK